MGVCAGEALLLPLLGVIVALVGGALGLVVCCAAGSGGVDGGCAVSAARLSAVACCGVSEGVCASFAAHACFIPVGQPRLATAIIPSLFRQKQRKHPLFLLFLAFSLNFWLLADTAAPSLILGQMLGRWGNFFNREAFGGYTDNFFAMRYPLTDVRASDVTPDILEHLVHVNGVDYIQVHPTFLYESLWNLGVLLVLLWFQRHKKFDGQVAALYFFGYALGRVWIEGLRTDQLMIGSFAVSQVLSAVLILAAIVLYVYRRKKAQNISEI